MATVLECVAVPRTSGFRLSPNQRKSASSAVSAISRSGKMASLREFRGLKIQLQSPRRMSASVSSRNAQIVRRGGGIVCETKETAIEVPIVTDKTWQSLVLEADLPVLVEFWAPWCGPCRTIHPIIGDLSKQYAGKLKCYKLNTDESPSIATQYGIRSIPTVIIFNNGEKKDAVIGAVPKSTMCTCIEKFL